MKYLGIIITTEGVKPDPAKITTISNMSNPADLQWGVYFVWYIF